MLAKTFQDDVCNPSMLLESLSIDEDIVKVYANNPFHNQIVEDDIHHYLECGGAIS